MTLNQRIRNWTLYWPFRLSFFTVGVLLFLLTILFSHYEMSNEHNAWYGFILVFSYGFFLLSFTLFSILCFYAIVLFRNREQVVLDTQGKGFLLKQLWQPIWGFVRIRLKINGVWQAERIRLVPHEKHFLSLGRIDMVSVPIQAFDYIRVEKIDGILIYLEDPFRFFSFTINIKVDKKRYCLPVDNKDNKTAHLLVNPHQKNEISEIKFKNISDLFQLKQFEPGDDIRRIVWKLYARHKTMMVRKAEMDFQYLGNTRILILFNRSLFPVNIYEGLMYLETQYKQMLYDVLSGLFNAGIPLELVSPGKLTLKPQNVEQIAYWITELSWQTEYHVLPDTHAVDIVFISSVAPLDVIEVVKHNRISYNQIIHFRGSKEFPKYSLKQYFFREINQSKQISFKPDFFAKRDMLSAMNKQEDACRKVYASLGKTEVLYV